MAPWRRCVGPYSEALMRVENNLFHRSFDGSCWFHSIFDVAFVLFDVAVCTAGRPKRRWPRALGVAPWSWNQSVSFDRMRVDRVPFMVCLIYVSGLAVPSFQCAYQSVMMLELKPLSL